MKKINIIVSSKYLASCLNNLDLTYDVYKIIVKGDDCIILKTAKQLLYIHCIVESIDKSLYPEDIRWGWLRKLVNQVDEQPITINISEVSLTVSFNY